jgi:glycosyltransferase involved in cell wall biosynthesis
MKIRFVGPLLNSTGYSEFGRYFIRAFHEHDIPFCTESVAVDYSRPDLGTMEAVIRNSAKDTVGYDINIINMTPEIAIRFFKEGMPNIIFTMFETDRIPDEWVKHCNTAAAIFVPCTWNKEVFEKSGVNVPIYVVSPGIFEKDFTNRSIRYKIDFPTDVKFSFYSIFQWTERKNPTGLLQAYFSEFAGQEDVVLVLKTYGSSFEPAEQKRLRDSITAIKRSLNLPHFPKILFIPNVLSSQQIVDLHKQCNCFVLPHRAEGFGMPHMEAMAWAKPVITTGFSGNMDFMDKDTAYLLDYYMTPVCNMPWIRWYEGNMSWAQPDIGQLKSFMRYAYEHPDVLVEIGQAARKHIMKVLDWDVRLKTLTDALEEIRGK